ncbi:MAG: hypothetical protein PHS59_10715 [Paludibacter sp.]|nr:hypothetical protein [Paludibacter sp.]
MKDKKHIPLEEIGKDLPFRTPENYFEDFANRMEAQIVVKPVSIRKTFTPWMYMAAMFVGLLIVGQILFNVYQSANVKNEDNYESYVLSQVDEAAMIDYYVENGDIQ